MASAVSRRGSGVEDASSLAKAVCLPSPSPLSQAKGLCISAIEQEGMLTGAASNRRESAISWAAIQLMHAIAIAMSGRGRLRAVSPTSIAAAGRRAIARITIIRPTKRGRAAPA